VGGRRVDDLDAVLAEAQRRLGATTSDPEPLAGGITNRNYRIRFNSQDSVLRLAGKDTSLLGIDRRTEWQANGIAAELKIAPRVLASGEGWLVTEYVAGTPCDVAAVKAAVGPIGEALRHFHDCGAELPIRFWVPELLDDYAHVVRERGGEVPEAYGQAVTLANRIAERLPLTEPVPCHNDLLPANVLRAAEGRIMMVDWEYAGMGHRFFDLGNLAAGAEFGPAEEERLLTAYLGCPPSGSALAGLRLMRVMSDAREAAWGVVQGVVSELDFDFQDYAARHFNRLAAATRGRDFEEWLSAAAP
jgi:thiamine kinase-like enzyme